MNTQKTRENLGSSFNLQEYHFFETTINKFERLSHNLMENIEDKGMSDK